MKLVYSYQAISVKTDLTFPNRPYPHCIDTAHWDTWLAFLIKLDMDADYCCHFVSTNPNGFLFVKICTIHVRCNCVLLRCFSNWILSFSCVIMLCYVVDRYKSPLIKIEICHSMFPYTWHEQVLLLQWS